MDLFYQVNTVFSHFEYMRKIVNQYIVLSLKKFYFKNDQTIVFEPKRVHFFVISSVFMCHWSKARCVLCNSTSFCEYSTTYCITLE